MRPTSNTWNMHSFETSVRARYWRETARELLATNPLWIVATIYLLAIGGIIICRDFLTAGVIMVLAIVFSKPFMRALKSEPPPLPRPVAFGNDQAQTADVARLLAVIEKLERRVIQLEAAITAKEYDWEQRLSKAAPSTSTPSMPG